MPDQTDLRMVNSAPNRAELTGLGVNQSRANLFDVALIH